VPVKVTKPSPGLHIDRHRDRGVQHQRFQHVAAQVLVGPTVCVRELHPQFIGDPGNATDAGGGPATRPLQPEAGRDPPQRDRAAGGRYLDRLAVHLRVPGQLGGDVTP